MNGSSVVKSIGALEPAHCGPADKISRSDEASRTGAAVPYAHELRALGQALENQDLVSLELQVKGGDYVVKGLARSREEPPCSFLGRLAELIASPFRRRSGPAMQVSEVVYQFPPERIQQLDREGRKRRVDPDRAPDPSTLSQVLRSAGSYLDRKLKISFLGIAVKDHWVTVSYKTAAGHIERIKGDLDFFDDDWVKMYSRRRNRIQSALPNGPAPLVAREEINISKTGA